MESDKSQTAPLPNPGSDEAVAIGCTCPVLDNGRGRRSDGLFWFSAGCSVHDNDGRKPNQATYTR